MSLKFGILGLLKYGPTTGYEIDQYFKRSLSFFWTAQTSQIYRSLNQLEQEGYAEAEIVVQYDKPNKKVYHITPEGEAAFYAWISQTQQNTPTMRESFLMRIFFSATQGKDATIQTLQEYQENMQNELNKLNNIQPVSDGSSSMKQEELYWNLTLDFGKKYYEMCIEWAKNSIRTLMTN